MQNISPLVSSVTASKLPLVIVGSYTLLSFFSLVSLFKNKFGGFIFIPLINLFVALSKCALALFFLFNAWGQLSTDGVAVPHGEHNSFSFSVQFWCLLFVHLICTVWTHCADGDIRRTSDGLFLGLSLSLGALLKLLSCRRQSKVVVVVVLGLGVCISQGLVEDYITGAPSVVPMRLDYLCWS